METRIGVLEFYRGKKIFLTGCTGFLGMVIMEKLLYNLDVESIYILIREKKGKTIDMRVKEMADNSYFDTLRKKQPNFKAKLIPLNGDCVLTDLGLSVDDANTLVINTNIVIHCAATVKFDERLDIAYKVNVNGTKSIINLCHRMKSLQAFIHVSTAYSQCDQLNIKECFYDSPENESEIEIILSKLRPEEIEAKTKEIIGKWPNTYTFTKALAENLIRKECQNLPVAVFRPAIIVSTYQSNTPGWVNNYYGPMGASTAFYLGLSRIVCIREEDSGNMVPVDMVSNGIIAAAWEVATRKPRKPIDKMDLIRIYNFTSASTSNHFDWYEFRNLLTFYCLKYPILSGIRQTHFTITKSLITYKLGIFVYHYIPALFGDILLFVSGKTLKFLNMYKRIHQLIESFQFFVMHKWTFSNKNVEALYDMLSIEERQLLPMNILDVDWRIFMHNYTLGVRKYLIKEDICTLESARRKQQNFNRISILLRYIIYLSITAFVFRYILGK